MPWQQYTSNRSTPGTRQALSPSPALSPTEWPRVHGQRRLRSQQPLQPPSTWEQRPSSRLLAHGLPLALSMPDSRQLSTLLPLEVS